MALEGDKYGSFTISSVARRMKSILVLGGTGAMGMHLVQLLAEQGNMVSVTTRSKRQPSSNIDYIQGDAKDDSFLARLLVRKWDAIIDFMVYSTAVFELRMPKLLSATTQYIFLSSARVYADSVGLIQEDSPRLVDRSSDSDFLATDEYSLAKARQEDILSQSGNKNWTIIRPYITYSEQRLQLGVLEKEGWLYRALKGRTIVFSEDIATRLTTLTYGLDVAVAITTLVGEPRAFGEVYHITQSKAVSWCEVLNVYLDVLETYLGNRPKVLMVGLEDFTRCKRAEYQIKYDRLFNRTFNSSKIAGFVDVDAFLPVEQGLAGCLEEFLKKTEFQAIDWSSEGTKDRYTGEMANLAEIGHWKHRLKYLVYRFIKR